MRAAQMITTALLTPESATQDLGSVASPSSAAEPSVDAGLAVDGDNDRASSPIDDARSRARLAVAAARGRAQQLVTEAEQQARQVEAEAREQERRAEQDRVRAAIVAAVNDAKDQVAAAEALVAALAAEQEKTAAAIANLDQRLGELAKQRAATTATLTEARTAGDVDAVLAARQRLAALDDVTTTQTEQRRTTQARLDAIGVPDGAGELNAALQDHQRAETDLRAAQNEAQPNRPEAQLDRAVAELRACVAAYMDQYRADQTAADRPIPRTYAYMD